MAPNADPFFIDTVRFLATRADVKPVIRHDLDWVSRESLLDSGAIEVGWICGLPYVWKADEPSAGIELLAAPVMSGARYADRPVYFSDVMVRADSHFQAFEDLRGARMAFNEPRSHSGCNVLKAHLFDLGESASFFAAIHEAGSHERALEWIIEGRVDAAAIDTTVFETAIRIDPSLGTALRTVETLGPSPMPPWVVSKSVEAQMRDRLRSELVNMHRQAEGKIILQRHAATRFELVDDAFYDTIRSMDQKAHQVSFEDT